jgi:hypothetical protein
MDLDDHCPSSLYAPTDAVGCTEDQAAGCTVAIVQPEPGFVTEGETLFTWTGTCDVYLIQFAYDPSFPPGLTRSVRTTVTEVALPGDERYWRVVGGKTGGSTGVATPAREINW